MLVSEHIADFLNYIRSSKTCFHIAETTDEDTSKKTQDILHALELQHCNYHERAKLATELVCIRQERRDAKDVMATVEPLIDWAKNNEAAIRSLEKVLGEIRKVEKSIESRTYYPRTEVVKQVLGGKTK